jgi:hypothetical protein
VAGGSEREHVEHDLGRIRGIVHGCLGPNGNLVP